MSTKNEIIEQFFKNEKICELKIGNLNVEMKYTENDTKIDDCLLNILKQKIK